MLWKCISQICLSELVLLLQVLPGDAGELLHHQRGDRLVQPGVQPGVDNQGPGILLLHQLKQLHPLEGVLEFDLDLPERQAVVDQGGTPLEVWQVDHLPLQGPGHHHVVQQVNLVSLPLHPYLLPWVVGVHRCPGEVALPVEGAHRWVAPVDRERRLEPMEVLIVQRGPEIQIPRGEFINQECECFEGRQTFCLTFVITVANMFSFILYAHEIKE